MWQETFDALMAYKYNDNGHGNVPVADVTENGLKLGSWCTKQRRLSKAGKLPDERLQKLKDIEFDWTLRARRGK